MSNRTTTDSRQVTKRGSRLTQISSKTHYDSTADSKPASVSELDNLLEAINSDLTSPLRMDASDTPDLIVSVGSSVISTSETGRQKTIPHIGSLLPDFTSGTITFPATSGTVTVSPGTNTTITIGNSEFVKVTVSLDNAGNLVVAAGVAAASQAAALAPSAASGTLPIGYIVVETDGSGNIQNVNQNKIFQFAVGGGASDGGTGSGDGFDLNTLSYYVNQDSDFSNDDLVDTSASNSSHSSLNENMSMEYDATEILTVVANNVTTPNVIDFTVAVGDIIQTVGGTKHTKITTVNSQQDFDVEDGSVLTSGSLGLISQSVQLEELTDYGDANFRVSDQIDLTSATLEEILVTYFDSAVEKPGVAPDVAFSACSNTTINTPANWSVTSLRPEGLADQADPIVIPNGGNEMRVRFFANKSSGSGTVTLDSCELYYIPKSDVPGFVNAWAAYRYNFSAANWLTPQGSGSSPSVSLVGGKTRLDLGFIFDTYRAENAAKSQISVMVNGQEVFKELGSLITGDYNYTVVDSHTIDFNTDLTTSATDDIEIVVYIHDAGSVDVAHVSNRFTTDGVYFDDDQEAHIRFNTTTNIFEGRADSTSNYLPLGGGTGGEGSGDTLLDAELGLPYEDRQNMLLDTFNTELGTKVKLITSGSALRFDPAETTGASYIRSRLTSAIIANVDGKMVVDIQMFKPQATVISGNSIVFDGDVSAYFVAGNNVLLGRVEESDDRMIIRHLLGTDDKPAILEINTSSYSSVNDETTIALLNPDALDLNIGLTVAADVEEKLRMMPFEWAVYAASDDSSTWELMTLEEGSLYSTGQIGLAGEGFFSDSRPADMVGTAYKTDIKFSPNKQYGIKRYLEHRTTTDYWVYEYTVNQGKSWHYFGGAIGTSERPFSGGSPSSRANEHAGQFFYTNRGQIQIADNGKFFECHPALNGSSQMDTRGEYGDLQATTPSLNLCPDRGSGAGVIYTSSSYSSYGKVAMDLTDGSYVSVLVADNTPGLNLRSYNGFDGDKGDGNGTPTYLGNASWGNIAFTTQAGIVVSGTGISHVTHGVKNDTALNLYGYRTTEAAPNSSVGGGAIDSANDPILIDYKVAGDRLILLTNDTGNNYLRYRYKTISTNTWDSNKILSNFGGVDRYQGWSAANNQNYHKSDGQKIVVDPSDDKHVFFVQEDSSQVTSSILYEVKDITSYTGETISQTTNNAWTNLRDTAGEKMGQTFQAVDSSAETITLKLRQLGIIEAGKKVWAEIWNTSAGLPTTKITNADSQLIEAANITTNSNGQIIRFNFPRSISLTPSTTYAIVLDGDYDVSGSNNIEVNYNNSSVYANGTYVSYNGSAWSAGSSYDLWFKVASHRATDIGNSLSAEGSSPFNSHIRNGESSIKLINDTNIQFITRRIIRAGSDSNQSMSGHPYRKVIPFTAGGSVECDTSGELVPVTLNNVFDENLVFNVSMGNPVCTKYDLVAGVSNDSSNYWQRSGIPNSANKGGSPTIIPDSDFESEYCALFGDNESEYYQYGNNTSLMASVFDVDDRDLAIEAEIKGTLSGTSTRYDIFSITYLNTNGLILDINSSGYLEFNVTAGGSNAFTTANDKVEPSTYHKVRVTKKNGVVKLWRAENPANNYTVFTEVAGYSSNGANNLNPSMGTNHRIQVGNELRAGGYGQFRNGKIGYVKMVVYKKNEMDETNPFAYDGFKDQSAIVSLQNHGHLISGENVTGYTSSVISDNYDIPMLSDGQESALVDSYRQLLKYKKQGLSNQGQNCKLKIEMARGTANDQSNIQGLQFEFTKQ